MAEINTTEYEHRMRQADSQSDQQLEHNQGQVAIAAHEFNPSTLVNLSAGSSINSSARATAMHGAQHAYGNRAVQRFLQRMKTPSSGSKTGAVAVQRYRRPSISPSDSEWATSTLMAGAAGASGLFGSLPVVGNLWNAAAGGGQLLSATIASAMGDEEGARYSTHNAQNNFLNAIPGYGNMRSFNQGVHDEGAFFQNLFGGGSQAPDLSRDIYHKESGPKFDDFFSSLF